MNTATEEIRKGLSGVVVDTSAVSKVMAETNSLTYRGYPVQDLAAHCSFEQVAFLLWYGELPDETELERFCERERSTRRLSPRLESLVAGMSQTCHPMDVLRTAVSYLGSEDPDEGDDLEVANYTKALEMLAVLPTVVAADLRRRRGQQPIAPDEQLGYAENFLAMCFGQVPEPVVVTAFEQSMILYAEHGFNASTFAARVVTSTESDIYSAITAAIGALKGPLHGGANEAVMHDMLEIGEPGKAAEWVRTKMSRKEKVMGFGHRVYKDGDSRVPTMKDALSRVAAERDGQRWMQIYEILESEVFDAKGLNPNVDFATGPAYYLMGFDITMFTPLFVMARITGWAAHIVEQTADNALIRPLSAYSGYDQRELPMD